MALHNLGVLGWVIKLIAVPGGFKAVATKGQFQHYTAGPYQDQWNACDQVMRNIMRS